MRIQVEALDKAPPHALNPSDVKAIFAVVPEDWQRYIRIVRLSATLPEHSRFRRPVILANFRLTICSRGLSLITAYKEALRELAVNGMKIPLRMVHRLSRADRQKVDQAIAPFMEQLIAETDNNRP